MKSSRFSMSSASAASPEVRVKDQPGGSLVPSEWRVAMRMPRVERATAAHGQCLRPDAGISRCWSGLFAE
jgi:hypothetical protein